MEREQDFKDICHRVGLVIDSASPDQGEMVGRYLILAQASCEGFAVTTEDRVLIRGLFTGLSDRYHQKFTQIDYAIKQDGYVSSSGAAQG